MLQSIIQKNEPLHNLIIHMSQFGLPDWYVGGGCIAQTVWNHLSGIDLNHGIMDIDIAYFDSSDLSYEAENRIVDAVKKQFINSPWGIDLKNEARVHLWYAEKFGYPINPYINCESAIDTWPTTATCVGIRYADTGMSIYAPYGLDDLFGRVVRPNKKQISSLTIPTS